MVLKDQEDTLRSTPYEMVSVPRVDETSGKVVVYILSYLNMWD